MTNYSISRWSLFLHNLMAYLLKMNPKNVLGEYHRSKGRLLKTKTYETSPENGLCRHLLSMDRWASSAIEANKLKMSRKKEVSRAFGFHCSTCFILQRRHRSDQNGYIYMDMKVVSSKLIRRRCLKGVTSTPCVFLKLGRIYFLRKRTQGCLGRTLHYFCPERNCFKNLIKI